MTIPPTDTPRLGPRSLPRNPSAAARAGIVMAAVAAVITAVAIVLLQSGRVYIINARFLDAGQLVVGDQVEVGGIAVGSVSGLSLTANGLANVRLSITARAYTPFHVGTLAQIRTVGQAGVANRYVAIDPGPNSSPVMASGAALSTRYTNGIVDLDELIDAFTPSMRSNLQALIAHGAQIFAGSGSRYFNQVLGELSPALAQTSALTGQMAQDRVALAELISTADTAATTLASRDADLDGALTHTARALAAVASERAPLADALQRAPTVLGDADRTLSLLRRSITVLRPALRAVPPVGEPLRTVLTRLVPTAERSVPVLAELTRLVPSLTRSLRGLTPLQSVAPPALSSTATALKDAVRIATGVRLYGADLILGVTNGLGGLATGNYDANGHYFRLEFVTAPQTAGAGLFSGLEPSGSLLPGQFGVREHLTARCPGGDAPPAPDGSNPIVLSKFWCNPADDVPLSVDFP